MHHNRNCNINDSMTIGQLKLTRAEPLGPGPLRMAMNILRRQITYVERDICGCGPSPKAVAHTPQRPTSCREAVQTPVAISQGAVKKKNIKKKALVHWSRFPIDGWRDIQDGVCSCVGVGPSLSLIALFLSNSCCGETPGCDQDRQAWLP